MDAAYQVFDVVRSEVLAASVPPRHWPSFVRSAYDANQLMRSDAHNASLYAWEQHAIDGFFPAAPATVLVGGAGAGREVRGLLERGYRVSAFDPAGALVDHGRAELHSDALLAFAVGGYEELISDELELRRHAPYDAVVLGWGSFSHVGDPAIRAALPRALRALCPSGPVLISWIAQKPVGPKREALRRVLRASGLRHHDGATSYRPHQGFVHSPSEAALRALAASGGYEVAHFDASVPYSVWIPASD